LQFQITHHKLDHREQIGLQLGHAKCIFHMNLVDLTSYDCFCDDRYSNGFDNIIIIQCTLREGITSLGLNVALCKIMCLVLSKSMIHLHILLERVPLCIKYVVVIVFCIFRIFAFSIFCFVTKTCNVAWFVAIEARLCAFV
jgi:hypothetical protein